MHLVFSHLMEQVTIGLSGSSPHFKERTKTRAEKWYLAVKF